jgi:deoxyribonuclease V
MTAHKINQLHSWEVTPAEAIALQKRLRDQVRLQPLPDNIKRVAGADISFNKYSDVVYAGIVVLNLPELTVETTSGVVTKTNFPYVPGLLSFREVPALLEAWEKLTLRPDVLMLDGQGIAHPRRLGIASHIGLLLNIPTIGCAKSLLVGKYNEPDEQAGSYSPLTDKGETIGAALRTKNRVNPVYISPGHLADLPGALALTMRCVKGYAPNPPSTTLFNEPLQTSSSKSKYRIPEPTRLAHLFVNALRRGEAFNP